MKILLGGYSSLGLIHGGPAVQLMQTYLELKKLGVEAELLDPYKRYTASDFDLAHIFAANIGTYHLAKNLQEYHLPFVVSSIFYTQHSTPYIKRLCSIAQMFQRLHKGIWMTYGITQEICSLARRVLPNTTDERNIIEHGLGIPSQKLSVVPNGVEPRFEYGDPTLFKKKYGIENFILNVGHIGPRRKNILNLIRALKHINHPAVIIGKITHGAYAEQCLAEAKENKNLFLIHGLENNSEVLASAYAASNVFALPSLFETPGIAALEAGLAGAKIVITSFGGTKDYFENFAEYTDPHSVSAIQQGIEKALNKKKDFALKEHIKRNFLWNSVAKKTLEVYKNVTQQ
ncbi:MAG: glycosyltransferase [Bacteroidetes bacterium]|nr:glycosyltransferase [Bacteroidota bacterium]